MAMQGRAAGGWREAVTAFEHVMAVFDHLPPTEGWVCTGLSNRWVTLRHPGRGRWRCRISRGGLVMEHAG